MENYKKINLNSENPQTNKDLDGEIAKIKKENEGIKTVAFSLIAICSAIIAGAAVSAAAFL